MNHLFGITNVQVFMTNDLDKLNSFLKEYSGNIIDIQCTDNWFHVIYKAWED